MIYTFFFGLSKKQSDYNIYISIYTYKERYNIINNLKCEK